jgi:hypothetical protein
MADDSSPQTPMPVGGNDDTHNQTDGKHGQHQCNHLPSLYVNIVPEPSLIPRLPKVGSQISEGCLVWIFWIVGSDFQGSGDKCTGYVFNCLAIIIFWLLAAQWLFEVWQNPKRIWILFSLLSLGTFSIYGGFIFNVLSTPKPHLVLVLNTSASPRVNLKFTNDFLVSKWLDASHPPATNETVSVPFLVIPVPEGHSSIVLKFDVENDPIPPKRSEEEDETLTAYTPRLGFLLAYTDSTRYVQWHPELPWKSIITTNSDAEARHFQFPDLLPGTREPSAGIPVTLFNDFPPSVTLRIGLRAKHIESFDTLVQVVFLQGVGGDPHFETNTIVAGHFRLERRRR